MSAVQKVQKHVIYIITYVQWLWRRQHVSCTESTETCNIPHNRCKCIVVMEMLRQHVSCTESKYISLFSLQLFPERRLRLEKRPRSSACQAGLENTGKAKNCSSSRRKLQWACRTVQLVEGCRKNMTHVLNQTSPLQWLIITVPMHKRIKYCLLKITFLTVKFAITPIDQLGQYSCKPTNKHKCVCYSDNKRLMKSRVLITFIAPLIIKWTLLHTKKNIF